LLQSASPLQPRRGINLGDVIIDADDLMGDGVNLAARLEGFARAAGITLSESISEQIRGEI
jgi:class 3 adenylate cyclase